MLEEILKLTALRGVTVDLHTQNYSWDEKAVYVIRIERDVDGEKFVVRKTGNDLKKVWAEAQVAFWSRITSGYAKTELQPNLLEAPKYEEATRALSSDIPF